MAIGRVGIRPYSGGTSTTTTTTAVSFDTDAQAFITATALTDTTQKNAINDLVLDLKAAGVWTKMKALYPMVGGTATTHKFNLKDPRDLDAAYRLVFNGGWTHSSTGALPNGTTGYADTYFNPVTQSLLYNNNHLSFYSRTSAGNTTYDMGSGNNINGGTSLFIYRTNTTAGYDTGTATANRLAWSGLNGLGFFVGTSRNPDGKVFRNGTQLQFKNPLTSVSMLSYNFYLCGFNEMNTNTYYSNKQCAFSSIGDGLTDLESNLFYQIVEKYQYALGRNVNANQTFYFNRNYSNETNAFIFNGAISDATQQSAINTLVNDLKAAGIWTKMKAVYPMVGGTATAHKFNLVNPVDTDAAYRLTFYGGWTHTSTGALPNGTTGYADTFLVPSTTLTNNSTHMLYYSRTQSNPSAATFDMGTSNGTPEAIFSLSIQLSNILYADSYNSTTNRITASNTTSLGGFMNSRTLSTSFKTFKNGVQLGTTSTAASSGFAVLGGRIYVGCLNYSNAGSPSFYSNRECAFSSIGDGLTDLESNLFYQIVEKFQYTLGRNINTSRPFYYNSSYTNETNAFIVNGSISDSTQISAVNTLVTTLKTAGIWTKMKAVYPMVGGTALAHKFNLVNPIDSTSAYALTFNGGWTHTSTGATPNGTTGYANTNLVPNTVDLGFNFNMNISFYSRTNRPSLVGPISDMGCLDVQGSYKSALIQFMNAYDLQTDGTNLILSTDTNTLGMIMASRTANNSLKAYRNGGLVGNNTATISNGLPAINYYLGAFLYRNASGGFANYYGTKECAFASIGNGLTDAEATTFYNAVQAFQTTLGRQV